MQTTPAACHVLETLGVDDYTIVQSFDELIMMDELVDTDTRRSLIAWAEAQHLHGVQDEKLELSPIVLADLIGTTGIACFNRLVEAFGADRNNQIEIKLRRFTPAEGQPKCINFHTDHALRTMQVPLNGPAECDGGKLVHVTHPSVVMARASCRLSHLPRQFDCSWSKQSQEWGATWARPCLITEPKRGIISGNSGSATTALRSHKYPVFIVVQN